MNDEHYCLLRADDCLAGAEREFANGCDNTVANRCYYGCFHVAVAALLRAGIAPDGHQSGRPFVQGQFVGQLITRRKRYAAELQETLLRNLELHQMADSRPHTVSQTQAQRVLSWTVASSQPFGREVSRHD